MKDSGISLGLGGILDTVEERLKTQAMNQGRAQNGGTPEKAIATTWRDPASYAFGPIAEDTRDRKRGGTNTF